MKSKVLWGLLALSLVSCDGPPPPVDPEPPPPVCENPRSCACEPREDPRVDPTLASGKDEALPAHNRELRGSSQRTPVFRFS